MNEDSSTNHEPLPIPAAGAAGGTVHVASCRCVEPAQAVEPTAAAASYVYALGRIEPRFPTLGAQREYAQVIARGDYTGKTDAETLHAALTLPENRYLAKMLCWVFSVEGVPMYVLKIRDPFDLDLLIAALRPVPRATDVDVVIGVRGPLCPSDTCNGLSVPIVLVDQLYSFDVEHLKQSIPKPASATGEAFVLAVEALFSRIQQLADNAGADDGHRALNYLALRYPAIYALAADAFARNAALTSVETRLSALSGARRIYDAIFTFTHRTTDVAEKHFARVDVTDEFPFLVTKLSAYFDR